MCRSVRHLVKDRSIHLSNSAGMTTSQRDQSQTDRRTEVPLAASWKATAGLTVVLLASLVIGIAREVDGFRLFLPAAWAAAFAWMSGIRWERQR